VPFTRGSKLSLRGKAHHGPQAPGSCTEPRGTSTPLVICWRCALDCTHDAPQDRTGTPLCAYLRTAGAGEAARATRTKQEAAPTLRNFRSNGGRPQPLRITLRPTDQAIQSSTPTAPAQVDPGDDGGALAVAHAPPPPPSSQPAGAMRSERIGAVLACGLEQASARARGAHGGDDEDGLKGGRHEQHRGCDVLEEAGHPLAVGRVHS